MSAIADLISQFASFAWGYPLLILLIGGGLYLTVLSSFSPIRHIGHAIDLLRGKYDDENGHEGELSHFQALTTSLSNTIGMGNIAGVAVAISIGGPGAIFWMWMSAIIGMTTKFFTCSLAIMYRGKDSAGNAQGGPMYFITEGLGQKWRPMAVFFSFAGMMGALPLLNTNQLTQAIRDIILIPHGLYTANVSEFIIGLILIAVTAVVILGGIKRIGSTAAKLVPLMVVLYFLCVLIILVIYADKVPYYLGLIVTDAFSADLYSGNDSIMGGAIGALIILGVRRGAFSNEAGIGTAPMAHGASQTQEPIREGLVAMIGPFIDTIIVCTLTALTILVTDVWKTAGADVSGVTLTAEAFSTAMPGYGQYLLMVCIAIFSISSLLSFSYYGHKCLSFIAGADKADLYNYAYLISIFLGAMTTLTMMLDLIDGFYGLMAFPTMIATLILAPKVVARAKEYFATIK